MSEVLRLLWAIFWVQQIGKWNGSNNNIDAKGEGDGKSEWSEWNGHSDVKEDNKRKCGREGTTICSSPNFVSNLGFFIQFLYASFSQ